AQRIRLLTRRLHSGDRLHRRDHPLAIPVEIVERLPQFRSRARRFREDHGVETHIDQSFPGAGDVITDGFEIQKRCPRLWGLLHTPVRADVGATYLAYPPVETLRGLALV